MPCLTLSTFKCMMGHQKLINNDAVANLEGFVRFYHVHACLYFLHYSPDCNSLSTIWGAEAACLLLILFTRLLYFTLCKSEQLFPSACMNQCLPGASARDCMQFNTSNLCFNYDDLLSVGSLAPSSVCCIVHWLFHCLHRQTVVFDCIHQIALNHSCADWWWWWWWWRMQQRGCCTFCWHGSN